MMMMMMMMIIIIIWWLFKLKVIFFLDPILDVSVLKSNHEESDRKFCLLCNHS